MGNLIFWYFVNLSIIKYMFCDAFVHYLENINFSVLFEIVIIFIMSKTISRKTFSELC